MSGLGQCVNATSCCRGCCLQDNDGSISYSEFNKQVGSLLHPSESGQLVVRQTFKYDPVGKRNRERRAGAARVETMFAQQSVARLQKAQDMFRRFDTDNSGTISHSEFIKALDAFGIQLGFQESKDLLMSFDTNQDGLVSLQEFTEHFTEYLKKFVTPDEDELSPVRARVRNGHTAALPHACKIAQPGPQ